GRRLAVACEGKQVVLYGQGGGSVLELLRMPVDGTAGLAFTPEGNGLIAAGTDGVFLAGGPPEGRRRCRGLPSGEQGLARRKAAGRGWRGPRPGGRGGRRCGRSGRRWAYRAWRRGDRRGCRRRSARSGRRSPRGCGGGRR